MLFTFFYKIYELLVCIYSNSSSSSLILSAVFLVWFSHFHFILYKNLPTLIKSVILVYLIYEYVVSLFIFKTTYCSEMLLSIFAFPDVSRVCAYHSLPVLRKAYLPLFTPILSFQIPNQSQIPVLSSVLTVSFPSFLPY